MNSISVDGQKTLIESACFYISIQSERVNIQTGEWCDNPMVSVDYELEIKVDSNSGEDGALAPTCSLSFIEDRDVKHLPLEKNSEDYCFDSQAPDTIEAFLGNDSWELENNRMTIKGFDGKNVKILWEAEYGDAEKRHAFLFEGLVNFDGIGVSAHTEADIEAAISQLWTPQLLRNQLLQFNKEVNRDRSPEVWRADYKLREDAP